MSERRRILVVEDDPSISLGLRMNLEAEGFSVQVAEDGEAGLDRVHGQNWDLVILDVMLPKVNGYEILKRMRGEGDSTPVLMLSARNAEMDKVLGLELGAEDYVTKPFGLAELLARVRAVMRRGAAAAPSVDVETFKFGDVLVDLSTREVRKSGALVDLTAKELDVLVALFRARGRVLSRQQIFDSVWGHGHHGTPRTIDNFVAQLRAKLEDDATEPKHLVTVRGIGYRFVG